MYQLNGNRGSKDVIALQISSSKECTNCIGSRVRGTQLNGWKNLRNVPTMQSGTPPRGGPKEDTNEMGGLRNVQSAWGRGRGTYQLRRGGPSLLLPSAGCAWARVAVAPLRLLCCAVLCGALCWSRSLLTRGPGRKIAEHGVPVMPVLSASLGDWCAVLRCLEPELWSGKWI